MNPFEELIQELGPLLNTSLKAEKGSLCHLLIHGSLKVCLEYEPSYERVLIASFLAELPPGKFREDVLKEGLKYNALPEALDGTFAYSEKNNQLVFFLYVPISSSPQSFTQILLHFVAEADTWKHAIETGNIQQISRPSILPPPLS